MLAHIYPCTKLETTCTHSLFQLPHITRFANVDKEIVNPLGFKGNRYLPREVDYMHLYMQTGVQ